MKYTIAIPAYNNSKIIRNAINSCIGQKTDFDFEIIISDDASTDNSQDIYEEFKDIGNLRVLYHESNSSLYENHNVCLREATGDYLLFCHADDTLYDDALIKLDLVLSSYNYPKKIVCWGRSFFRDFYSSFSQVGELNKMVSGINAQQLFQNGGLTPSGTCYSRESFIENGGFLPMRSNITPSDMSSMIKYSLDGAEFLMLDRLLFKREFASTACGITQEDSFKSVEDAIGELAKVLPPQKMETLFNNIEKFNTFNLYYMLILSKYSTNKRLKNKYKLRFILKNPLSLRNKFIRKILFTK